MSNHSVLQSGRCLHHTHSHPPGPEPIPLEPLRLSADKVKPLRLRHGIVLQTDVRRSGEEDSWLCRMYEHPIHQRRCWVQNLIQLDCPHACMRHLPPTHLLLGLSHDLDDVVRADEVELKERSESLGGQHPPPSDSEKIVSSVHQMYNICTPVVHLLYIHVHHLNTHPVYLTCSCSR